MAAAEDDFLKAYDAAPLTWRYFAAMGLLVFQSGFEFFDFFVVGYLVAVLAPIWHLTFGQSSAMLIGAGLGAIIGSLLIGKLADRVGRKPAIILSNMIVAIGAGGIAVMPEHSWLFFALMRILVGCGLGAAQSTQTPLIVEMTPTRCRTLMSSAMIAPASAGILLAAGLSSTLLPVIGWRGLSAIGTLPAFLALASIVMLPESPRWLMSRGRFAEARRAAAWQMGVAEASLPLPGAAMPVSAPRPAALRELLRYPRAFWLIFFTWLGMSTVTNAYQMWGPTILSGALHMPVARVAGYFTIVGVAGLFGRFVFSVLPVWIGRRHSGQIMAVGSLIFVLLAGFTHGDVYGSIPAFIVWLTPAALFVNGGISNMNPYAPETYPVRLAACAAGWSQAVNGMGKMAGPLLLGAIAGGGNLVTPTATDAAIIPSFVCLGLCCLMAALAYTLLPIETNNRPVIVDDETQLVLELENKRSRRA